MIVETLRYAFEYAISAEFRYIVGNNAEISNRLYRGRNYYLIPMERRLSRVAAASDIEIREYAPT